MTREVSNDNFQGICERTNGALKMCKAHNLRFEGYIFKGLMWTFKDQKSQGRGLLRLFLKFNF